MHQARCFGSICAGRCAEQLAAVCKGGFPFSVACLCPLVVLYLAEGKKRLMVGDLRSGYIRLSGEFEVRVETFRVAGPQLFSKCLHVYSHENFE